MLKEINSSKDVITNVDLFNEIIELVKNSKDTALMKCEGELPPFVDYAIPESYVSGIYDCEFDPLFSFLRAITKDIIWIFLSAEPGLLQTK